MIRFVGNAREDDRHRLGRQRRRAYLPGRQEGKPLLPAVHPLPAAPALGGVRGQACDITIEAEEILKMRARLIKEIAVETGQPYEKVVTDTERNFWMGAEEALKYGLVAQGRQPARERSVDRMDVPRRRRWWRGAVDLSGLCPQLLRRQWRRAGRLRRADLQARLHRVAGRGCDLAVADPSLAQSRLGL